jgi:1-acyl-sn-glycerol-3-phosphate acyltransferase
MDLRKDYARIYARRFRSGLVSLAVHRVLRAGFGFLLLPYWQPSREGLGGIAQDGPLLVACNHPTMLDPILLVVLFPRRLCLLMGRQVRGIPLLGWLFHQSGHVTTGEGCLQECQELLDQGLAVGIFPEGEHTYSDRLGEKFHSGVSVLAKRSGVPVVPVSMLGHQHYLSHRARFMKGGPMKVSVGEPLTCGAEESVAAFSQRLQAALLEQMEAAAASRRWRPDWRFRLAQAFWVPFSWSVFALADRLKPGNIR